MNALEKNQAMKIDHDAIGQRNRRSLGNAFTLTELLVVIATLALLALVVLPALAHTNDNSTRLVCMHNLRQMAMAMNMYAGDNRDSLAYPNWDSGNTGSPSGWLYLAGAVPALGGGIPNPYSPATPYAMLSNGTQAWQSGSWFQYVQNTKSYLCPVDIESRTYLPPSGSGGRQNKLSTYVMNGAVTSFPGVGYGTPCKLTDVWSPGCYLLWEPDENASGLGVPGAFEYNDGANFPASPEGIGRLHSASGGNMLCVGGNVEFVTVQAWNAQIVAGSGPGPGGKTLAWWAPLAGNGN